MRWSHTSFGCLFLERCGALRVPCAVVSVLLLWSSPADTMMQTRYQGRDLAEVLLEVEAQGLPLVFSTSVVTKEMKIIAEPEARAARELVEELLAQHGLGLRVGIGETLVVVPLALTESATVFGLEGRVLSRRGRKPVSGVQIRVAESGRELFTAQDGRFEVLDLEPGRYRLEARHPEYVVLVTEVSVAPSELPTRLIVLLQPAPLTREEIVVNPSQVSLRRERPATPLALSERDLDRLPHLGDDIFRALPLLPGVAANDISAQFHLRGGRTDETQILLDGQELYEAFHLKDYGGALSLIAPSALRSVDLTTGGAPAVYGDRMSGVLRMTTSSGGERHVWMGLSVLNTQIGGGGTFGEEREAWLASMRRGSTDLAGRAVSKDSPSFWDEFGKLDYRLGFRNALRLNALRSRDKLSLRETDGEETKNFETDYRNSYLWLSHQVVVRDDLFVDTSISHATIQRDRRGLEFEEEKDLGIVDLRESEVEGFLQGWHLQANDDHLLEWGFDLRQFETDYDYRRDVAGNLLLLSPEVMQVESVVEFQDSLVDDYVSAYVSDEMRLTDSLALVLGTRYDHYSLTNDKLWSPRVNAGWAITDDTMLRLSWGHHFQSQRSYELGVADGETTLLSRAHRRVGRGRGAPLRQRATAWADRAAGRGLSEEDLGSQTPQRQSPRATQRVPGGRARPRANRAREQSVTGCRALLARPGDSQSGVVTYVDRVGDRGRAWAAYGAPTRRPTPRHQRQPQLSRRATLESEPGMALPRWLADDTVFVRRDRWRRG